MNYLKYNNVTVPLPDDLYWEDELGWSPVVQTAERTITGALVIQTFARIAGRPLTLKSADSNSGWLTRSTLDQIRAWAAIPGCEMVVSYRGILYNAVWRHHEGEVLTANPVVWYSDVQAGDYYTATLKLMEI